MKKERTLIGTIELAAKLNCHPASIPRFVRIKPGFPRPVQIFGKNCWDEEVVDHYVSLLTAEHERQLDDVRKREMSRKSAVA